jgi:hypothetical protein
MGKERSLSIGLVMAFRLTVEFLEDTLHGTRAAAAAHADVELVVMARHLGVYCGWGGCVLWMEVEWICNGRDRKVRVGLGEGRWLL